MDLAEVCRLGGRTAEAIDALGRAEACFAAKGNVASARRAADLAQDLRAVRERLPS
jgi:hypothetical protein